MANKQGIYAIYRGDKFIDVGTLKELSVRNNIVISTLRFEASPTYAERTSYEDSLRVYRIEEDEGEDLIWKNYGLLIKISETFG